MREIPRIRAGVEPCVTHGNASGLLSCRAGTPTALVAWINNSAEFAADSSDGAASNKRVPRD
jgi:hypothetical protein